MTITAPVDFVIVTALPIERDAVLRRIQPVEMVQEDGNPHTYYVARLDATGTGRYRVVLTMLLGPGNYKASAALDHQCIVPIYDYGEQSRQPYIVMRYMAGGTLAERLARGPVPLANIIPILQRVAKLTATISDSGLTIGTPAYMSPEQVNGDKALTGHSDIYSLGVVLYEMLTDQSPYRADGPLRVMLKHLHDPVPQIANPAQLGLPVECNAILSHALAKKPDEPFPDTDLRVARGGSWNDTAYGARCSFRHVYPPGYYFPFVGFRIVVAQP